MSGWLPPWPICPALPSVRPAPRPRPCRPPSAGPAPLAYQRCPECSGAVFPPRILCPFCGSGILEWLTSTGRGHVYACTTLRPQDSAPYTVALVDLYEGFRMMTTVTASDASVVEIGEPVSLRYEQLDSQPSPSIVK